MADKPNFLKLRVHVLAEELAHEVQEVIQGWDAFATQTAEKQILNVAEGG